MDKSNNLIKESINLYNLKEVKCFYCMKVVFRESRYYETSSNMFGIYKNYTVGVYPTKWSYSQLENSTDISYFRLNGNVNTVSDFKSYLYDSYNQVSTVSHTDSGGKIEGKLFKYAYDFNQPGDNIYVGMSNKNVIAPVIETTTKLGTIPTSLEKKTFKAITVSSGLDVYVPGVIKYAKSGNVSDLEDIVVFHNYDGNANPIEISKKDDSKICYIWGYKGQYPIAKIENISYSSIPSSTITNLQNLSDADTDNCVTSTCNEQILREALNAFRISLPNTMITTYTYNPLVGVTSITDPKGYKMFYTYDGLGRLESVKDADGIVLSKNEYHYKN